MEIKFILVEPAVAGNVGSSARALKTMGFKKLAVVNSRVHLSPEARWLAHGSHDVLEEIEVFDTLGEAVDQADLVIGTTAKKRRIHADHYLCDEISGLIKSKAPSLKEVALVFGREESGLTNNELKLCHIFTGIPMAGKYPSLNLAQSVMIYAWELSQLAASPQLPVAKAPATAKSRHLRNLAASLLSGIGYRAESPVYSRIMERLEAVGDKDAGLLLSVCSRLDEMLPGDTEQGNKKEDIT